ncbi:DUF190 domain-containing protein [Candidatus Neptunichlamydia sp. REUL1]|uniref:DUF190 domain-containing protein n=1 Tax=Candidatus Neptunichlamydia sp. REUL1 TaxID=3064277 RepID=UPI00292EFBC3|nr:DUF190 domain-containing protein [Candidatus Neptunochlamydia sp. REUL1]
MQIFHFPSLSLDLPLVVEFFDTPQQVAKATTKIQGVIDKGHILILQGQVAS